MEVQHFIVKINKKIRYESFTISLTRANANAYKILSKNMNQNTCRSLPKRKVCIIKAMFISCVSGVIVNLDIYHWKRFQLKTD